MDETEENEFPLEDGKASVLRETPKTGGSRKQDTKGKPQLTDQVTLEGRFRAGRRSVEPIGVPSSRRSSNGRSRREGRRGEWREGRRKVFDETRRTVRPLCGY